MSSAAPSLRPEARAPKPVGAGFITLYALAMFGIWMSIMLPASVTLALRISQIDPDGKNVSYSIAAGVGTLVALIANPLFGRLSDRTRSRFGRRRPWIVIGLAGTIVGAVIIGLSNSFPLLLLGWIIMQAFVNAAIAATLAIVPDRIPESQQGLVGALSGMASSAAVLVGVFFVQWFPTNVLAQFGLPVLVAVLFAGLLVALFRDDKPAPADIGPFDLREFLGSFYINPRKSPDFAKFLVASSSSPVGWVSSPPTPSICCRIGCRPQKRHCLASSPCATWSRASSPCSARPLPAGSTTAPVAARRCSARPSCSSSRASS